MISWDVIAPSGSRWLMVSMTIVSHVITPSGSRNRGGRRMNVPGVILPALPRLIHRWTVVVIDVDHWCDDPATMNALFRPMNGIDHWCVTDPA